ncbi:MAG: hypothetical protein H0W16_14860 [Actinobacteria bacterium]|nr:hypothetical protein [Actinomycetota bacterium]
MLLAGALCVGLAATGSGTTAPSRTVDRTFACTPLLAGGGRELDLWASPPRSAIWTIPAYLVARTGTTLPSEDLVYVRARTQGKIGWTSPFSGPGGVYAHSRRCSPARASVALSSKGLPGTPTGWYSPVSCTLRGRVLVRVRALLSAPAGWGRAGPLFQGARKDVLEASLAIRSERTGEPLAFMTLNRAGETRLWSSSRCR